MIKDSSYRPKSWCEVKYMIQASQRLKASEIL